MLIMIGHAKHDHKNISWFYKEFIQKAFYVSIQGLLWYPFNHFNSWTLPKLNGSWPVVVCGSVALRLRALPYVLIGHLVEGLDGGTLQLVLVPGRSLTGAVTVLSKLTRAAALQLLLPTEAAVTRVSCQTAQQEKNGEQSSSRGHGQVT